MSKVYKVVTDKIIAQLEAGVIPWSKPWAANGEIGNFVSKKPYTGINPFLLNSSGYSCPHWLTFKQAKDLKGSVRKGEKGEMIVYFNMNKSRDKVTGEESVFPILRYYTVFNLEQCDGIEWDKEPSDKVINTIDECESIVKGYSAKPSIKNDGGNRAFYSPSRDAVSMPHKNDFESAEKYYSVLFHELIHSTGHINRLKREGVTDDHSFGSHEYSKEELVAEFGAAMLCGVSGIEQHTIDNSAAHIKGWIRKLKNDDHMLMWAASRAQKAADHIRGIKKEVELSKAA